MQSFKALLFLAIAAFSACTSIERAVHMYSADAPRARLFAYADGGSSDYYTFDVGTGAQPETFVFFYGGSGCASWKSVMPGYVKGLINARVFALNKRYVDDRSAGLLDCGKRFDEANNPNQWFSDYAEFINAQLKSLAWKPRHIVLVGVSEGALVAGKVAGRLSGVTHVAIIGHGGYTLRESIRTLAADGRVTLDADAIWKQVASDPSSLEKRTAGHPYRYWSDIMDFDPLPNYLGLHIPIIVGIGERDMSVPVESARYLQLKLAEAGKDNLTLKVYPKADHRLYGDGVSFRDDFFSELSRHLR